VSKTEESAGRSRTILYLLPVAFFQKSDEPGFQVQTLNFRTAFSFMTPELRGKGMEVALVSLNNNERQIEYGRDYLAKAGLSGACRAFFFERKAGRGRLFPQLLQLLFNLRWLFQVMRHVRPDVLYGYNDVGTLYGVLLKLIFRFRLVYDMRGDRVNEMAVQGAPGWRIRLYNFIRKLCLSKSDLVFTVSDECRDLPEGQRHVAKYNFYDATLFSFNEEEARRMKEGLGLANRFVMVYSGTDKYYQMVPQMVAFFAGFRKICSDAFFMINIPLRSEVFERELQKWDLPDDSFRIFHLSQNDLNRYQTVADLALLIREDLPLNHEAFPTKFPEYLAGGVPVLVTPHVHTLASMVRENELGEVWHDEETAEDLYERLRWYRNNWQKKRDCARFAREKLSWQNNASSLAGILDSL
jgi:glycosyltransferase involved in cell wall biosynthesis